MHPFPGARMPEVQLRSMQRLPDKAQIVPAGGIYIVPDQGMTYVRHMHPYLMRAPRLQLDAQQRFIPEPLKHGLMGYRFSAVRHDRHALPFGAVTAYGRIYGAAVIPKIPLGKRDIDAAHGMGLELG